MVEDGHAGLDGLDGRAAEGVVFLESMGDGELELRASKSCSTMDGSENGEGRL